MNIETTYNTMVVMQFSQKEKETNDTLLMQFAQMGEMLLGSVKQCRTLYTQKYTNKKKDRRTSANPFPCCGTLT